MKNPATATSTTFSVSEVQYKYAAIFARAGYNLADKYLLNLTGRRDGSSRFGPGRQFGMFGAVGAAWIFSKEKFIKHNARFLSFGKLRGSIGTTGNDQIQDYGYLSAYTTTGNQYQGIPGLYPGTLDNPNYGWETIKKSRLLWN
ncbi:TonB-dependent receptor [Chitinophaga sedimenti]|uniref:TonB-dependent receptor n=1 Tax=Chitinophaga sedimenti TaxID=2033606 RepID=UPI00200354F1|nr:TonB-dependent receptor [Chitinophaga sedimenti]MCK7557715.1 TonB-dependent receptor [Chitinophaga sedimenti]